MHAAIDIERRVENMKHNEQEANKDRLVDENLKRVFGDMLEEGVPDRFRKLLDDLKNRTSGEAGEDRETGE